MRTRVVFRFSCTIYQGQNQVVQYHKTLSSNGTFTSLSQVEEYIKQCELRRLDLDDEEIWSKSYLPAARLTNDLEAYKGRDELRHVEVWLISSNEPLLCCVLCPIGFAKSGVFTPLTAQKITCVFDDALSLPTRSEITKQDWQKARREMHTKASP